LQLFACSRSLGTSLELLTAKIGPRALLWSTDVWATRRLSDRHLGDRFLDDHLGDTGWTFRRQQFDVCAAMSICSGKGFSSSESTSKTLLQVGVGASMNLA